MCSVSTSWTGACEEPDLRHAVPRSVVFGVIFLRSLVVNPDFISARGTGLYPSPKGLQSLHVLQTYPLGMWWRIVLGLEDFSGPKICTRPKSTRITSYPNPMCINIFLKKDPTRDRPDEIRPESDLTRWHIFRTWLDPNVNSIDVGTACSPAVSQDKIPVSCWLIWLLLHYFHLFIYLFIITLYFCLSDGYIISEFVFQLWPDLKTKRDSLKRSKSIA